MADEQVAQIKIDGVAYDLPQGSLKLGEMRIVERYCGGENEDDAYGIAKTCGLIHVAIQRARPGTPFDEIQQVVDNLDFSAVNEALTTAVGDADPPAEKSFDDEPPSNEGSSLASEPVPDNVSPINTGDPTSPTGSEFFRATSAA